ncbi:hypothetical protein C0J52_13811 [Blattella germanica]|nr:hypothetical protein C0J52_13811 [Blattella germanica]
MVASEKFFHFKSKLTSFISGGGGLRFRRRPHRLPRANKERCTRGSIWLQSPLMGLTAEDSRQQVMSRDEEEAMSGIDSSNEDSDDSLFRSSGEDSMDCKSSSDKDDKTWSREEMLRHQHRLLLLRRREGLLDITMRTVNLMRRNQQLQHRLAALQAETRAFVRSVLSNPENQAIRELTLRPRRKSKYESEDEEGTFKRIKPQGEATSDIISLDPSATIEQDPSVSAGDGDK